MNNLEWLKKNLTKEMKECCSLCRGVYKTVNGKSCDDENDYIECENCKFCKLGDMINFLSQEHKEPIKLKQWEYDLIKSFDVRDGFTFECFRPLKLMKEIGYFSDIKDTTMNMRYILDNCEIVSDDYE